MRTLFLFCACLFSIPAIAQFYDNTWLIGYQGGGAEFGIAQLTFTNGSLIVKKSDLPIAGFQDNNASFSDSFGNLLATFNGFRVYNKKGNVMKGGDSIWYEQLPNLFGYSDEDLPQGGLFLSWPNHPDSLLLFYASQGNAGTDSFVVFASLHLQYALIRPSLNGGMGEVTQRRHIVIEDTIQYGRLQAVKHANGRDWWILINEKNSNRWYRVLFDLDGVHVLGEQTIGTPLIDGLGAAAFSPDGRYYAVFNSVGDSQHGAYLDVFDFDRCMGSLSNQRHLSFPLGYIGGIAISSNSRYLYQAFERWVYQYDLWASDLAGSKITVATYDGYVNPFATTFYQAQLGPDNKIYISAPNSVKNLHVIHHPDEQGLNCQVEQHGIILPVYNAFSVVNNPNYRLGPLDGSLCDTLGLDNLPISWWRSEQDTLNTLSVAFHDLSYYEPTTWAWDFGDPASGLNNISLERHPNHFFSTLGEHEVCLTVSNLNVSNTLCRMLKIGNTLTETPEAHEEIQVNPNPFISNLSVALSTDLQSRIFHLYDQMGRIIRTEHLALGITKVDTDGIPSGLYFWKVSGKEKAYKSGKLVKVKD